MGKQVLPQHPASVPRNSAVPVICLNHESFTRQVSACSAQGNASPPVQNRQRCTQRPLINPEISTLEGSQADFCVLKSETRGPRLIFFVFGWGR
jgi:hypothetical protein